MDGDLQAVVLCVQQSLWPLTEGAASCMLPVVNRPLLWYHLALLEKAGFHSVFVAAAQEDFPAVQRWLQEEYDGCFRGRCHLHCVEALDADYDALVLRELGTAGANGRPVPDNDLAGLEPQLALEREAAPSERLRLDKAFVVLSAALVAEDCLLAAIDLFRVEGADLAILLRAKAEGLEGVRPRKKKAGDDPDELYALDAQGRCVFRHAPEAADMVEESEGAGALVVPKALLKQRRRLRWTARHWDVGVYVMAPWIPQFLASDAGELVTSIRRELVPFIVNHQFRGAAPFGGWEVLRTAGERSTEAQLRSLTEAQYLPPFLLSATQEAGGGAHTGGRPRMRESWKFNGLNGLAQSPRGQGADLAETSEEQASQSEDVVRAFVVELNEPSFLCLRVDDIDAYRNANRVVLRESVRPALPWSSAVPEDTSYRRRDQSAVGPESDVHKRVKMSGCILGRGCRIAEGVKLNGAILMDGVTVEEGAVIQNSVLASGAVIRARARLNECLIGPGAVVDADVEAKEDTFAAGDL